MLDLKIDLNEEGFNSVPTNWIKWGKIGDALKGTLVEVCEKDNALKPGEKQKVYGIKIKGAIFHNIVDGEAENKETVLNENAGVWYVGGKKMIDSQMKNIKIGQKIIMKYTGDYKVKGQKPSKTIEVKCGGLDEAYLSDISGKKNNEEIPLEKLIDEMTK